MHKSDFDGALMYYQGILEALGLGKHDYDEYLLRVWGSFRENKVWWMDREGNSILLERPPPHPHTRRPTRGRGNTSWHGRRGAQHIDP